MAKDMLYCENPDCSKVYIGTFSDNGNHCSNCEEFIPKVKKPRKQRSDKGKKRGKRIS